MKRHELWRAQYNGDRYLRDYDAPGLKVRTDDVVSNNWIITDDLKLALPPPGTDDNFWMISWTHLLEEWATRPEKMGPPNSLQMPKLDWPGLASAVPAFQESRRKHPNVLVKYGSRVFLRQSAEAGVFRISPASMYADPSLNSAIQDDELELRVYRRSSLYTLLRNRFGWVLAPSGPKHGRQLEVLKAPTNYYVYCLGAERSLRMFGDFEADTAMVIHDSRTFIRRLGEGVRKVLGPGWSWQATPIKYVDPFRPPDGRLNIVESKHFRFAYQREYRIVWVPDKPAVRLEPFFVSVDPVADCASLLELSTTVPPNSR